MKRMMTLLLLGTVIAGCATAPAAPPTAAPVQEPMASSGPNPMTATPPCFPYHSPLAEGPGGSAYGFVVHGTQPLFGGAPIMIEGQAWPADAHSVQLILVPRVENAMWYGTRPDLADCLKPWGKALGTAVVKDGQWNWEGAMPAFQPDDGPRLVAVDDQGRYFLDLLERIGGDGAVKPYHLQLRTDGPPPSPASALWPVHVGEAFSLEGDGLRAPDGPVRIHLNYHDSQGNDWVPLGTGTVKGGRLETPPMRIGPGIQFLGRSTTVVAPETYMLIITNDTRPYTIFHTLSIRLLPQ